MKQTSLPPLCQQEECAIPQPRSEWGEGPWNGEPNRIDFRASGLDCFIHRNHPQIGTWCGYVGVSRSHPAFGHHYDEVDVDVHGGLTFSGKCHPGGHICHGKKGARWWLGYDCGHAGDYAPGTEAILVSIYEKQGAVRGRQKRPARPGEFLLPVLGAVNTLPDGTHEYVERYWSVDDVIRETTHLAHQLAVFTHHRLRERYGSKALKRISKTRDPKRQHERRMKLIRESTMQLKKWMTERKQQES